MSILITLPMGRVIKIHNNPTTEEPIFLAVGFARSSTILIFAACIVAVGRMKAANMCFTIS